MKKNKWIAWLLCCLLLLCGCAEEEQAAEMDEIFITTEAALEGGHFFFTGEVLSVVTEDRLISKYEAYKGENTFYSVEVTDDYYNCMPDRTIIVCVLGSEEFPNRDMLKKDREYLFDTTLWVEGDQTIFLLPTFHSFMPELQGDQVYSLVEGERVNCGTLEEYKERLERLAEKVGYGPQTVLSAAKLTLESVAERVDPAYFEKMGYPQVDQALLKKTGETATALLKKAEKAESTWKGIGELIK